MADMNFTLYTTYDQILAMVEEENKKVDAQIQELLKVLEMGNYNAAPSELVQGCGTIVDFFDLPPPTFDPKHISLARKTCECGAAKTGIKAHQAGHSSWCPLK